MHDLRPTSLGLLQGVNVYGLYIEAFVPGPVEQGLLKWLVTLVTYPTWAYIQKLSIGS